MVPNDSSLPLVCDPDSLDTVSGVALRFKLFDRLFDALLNGRHQLKWVVLVPSVGQLISINAAKLVQFRVDIPGIGVDLCKLDLM